MKNIESKVKGLPDLGYAALFTPYGMNRYCGQKRGWTEFNKGWKNAWGGGYIFKTEVAKQVLEHDFYKDHLKNYKLNQQIDHCIPEVIFQMGLNQYYHNPSFLQHIGDISTIGHKHDRNNKGLNY